MRNRLTRFALPVLLAAASVSTTAAPAPSNGVAGEDDLVSSRNGQGTSVESPGGSSDAHGSSKTIQLLLDLQKPVPAADGAPAPRAGLPVAKPLAQGAPPSPLGQTPASLGRDALRDNERNAAIASGQRLWADGGPRVGENTSSTPTLPDRGRGGGSPQSALDAGGRNAPLPWLAELLSLLREHREVVLIGSVLGVAVLAFGAAKSGNKHR